MKKKVVWFLILAVILGTVGTIGFLYKKCMTKCTAEFKGAYPEIACKYECSFFNKFKKPLKK